MIFVKKYFILICCFLIISCNQKTGYKGKFDIKISSKISFELDEPIVIPQNPFPPHQVFEMEDSISIFNPFKFGLTNILYKDTIIKSSYYKMIDQIKSQILESPDYMVHLKDKIIFLQNNSIIIYNDSLEFKKTINLGSLAPIKDWGIPYFKVSNNFEFGSSFEAYDLNTSRIYFFSKDLLSDSLEFFCYDFNLDKLSVMDVPFDRNIVRDQEIKYSKESIFTVDNLPFVLYRNGMLIFSYYSNSKIDVFIPTDNSSFYKTNSTISFPPEKTLIPKFPEGISAYEASENTTEWESEVAFGQLRFWKNCDCYYRIVKGSSREKIFDFDVFIEFFDLELNKFQENNLTEINSDLGTFSIPFKNEILIKSKDQYSEGNYYFYSLSIY